MLKTAYIHGQINALERFGVDPLEAQALLKTAAGGGALGSPAVPDVAPGFLSDQIAGRPSKPAAAAATAPRRGGSPAYPDVAPGYLTEQIARARGASAAAPAAGPAVITPSAPAVAAHVPPSVPVAVPAPSPAAGIPAAQGDLVEQLVKAESGKVPPGPKAPGAWFSKLRNSKVPLVGGLGLGTAIGAGLLIHGMRNPEMEVTPSAPIAPLLP
jgi:hypothetical protein